MNSRGRLALSSLTVACVAFAACVPSVRVDTGTAEDTIAPIDLGGDGQDSGDCTVIDIAVSPEKLTLMTELATEYNDSPAATMPDGSCGFARVYRKSSGAGAALMAQGWPDPDNNGAQPTIWSPSASAWGPIVNHNAGREIIGEGRAFMNTPLVIAMPKPMAEALRYPAEEIGFADIVELANDPEGWAKYGHPEWGRFKLGKTNPNFSTSGLNFTIAEYYAATGTKSGLSIEDLDRPEVEALVAGVESAVVHYGDTTLTFLKNWHRADARGSGLTYVSAVAVEEKSIIDYNLGRPTGTETGDEIRVPKIPLVAIYPEEGTLMSDNPLFIPNADWVSAEERAVAEAFQSFVLTPDNQARVLRDGFRPGVIGVPLATPIVAANGVNPDKPDVGEFVLPAQAVLVEILNRWEQNRKTARVLLVMDISGSMEDDAGNGESKLELAKRAAMQSLDEFKDDDEVGLWVFSTNLGPGEDQNFLELLPVQRIGGQKEALRNRIQDLFPTNGTPLYDVTSAAHSAMLETFDESRINAVVLLTDGLNDDGEAANDEDQRDALLTSLRKSSEGASANDVRVFTIRYGQGADDETLVKIAEASGGARYDASNPQTIEQVFINVISNF